MARKSEEFKTQLAIVAHHNLFFPHVKLIHIPNQTRDATEAYFNKLMGVQPGASDLLLGWKNCGVGVCEIKAPGEKPTSSQNKFLSWANFIGWKEGWVTTVKGYHELLLSWGLEPVSKCTYFKEPDLRSRDQKKQDAFNLYAPTDDEDPR